MSPNVVDNHQEASSNLVGAFFAHKAALVDVCDFLMFVLIQLFSLHQTDKLKSRTHF